jgi:hypothetical protein
MKALITRTIEHKAMHHHVVDLRGQMTEVLVTTKFLGITIYKSREYFTLPEDQPKANAFPLS